VQGAFNDEDDDVIKVVILLWMKRDDKKEVKIHLSLGCKYKERKEIEERKEGSL
jgi:hypothetical protein